MTDSEAENAYQYDVSLSICTVSFTIASRIILFELLITSRCCILYCMCVYHIFLKMNRPTEY